MASASEVLSAIESLTAGPTLDLSNHIEAFPEVEKAFIIPNTKLLLIGNDRSLASLDDGGSLELVGSLYVEADRQPVEVLQFHRKVHLDGSCAEHKWLKVAPWCRGVGISSAFLLRSFEFYRELGISRVELEAQMETGKWHWARVGFDFETPGDFSKVREWALEATTALGVDGLHVEGFTRATQFARMVGKRDISLKELAQAVPRKRGQAEKVAEQNSLQMETPIALGRAVMLTGPSWNGYLELDGPGYAQFKAYAVGKGEEAQGLLARR